MSNRNVEVVITRQTQPVSQAGFGLPLILATSKALAYTTYTDLTAVSVDFATGTEEYKLAAAIFNQTPRPEKVAIFGIVYNGATGAPADLIAALNDLVKEHNDWFYLTSVEQGDDEITSLAGWINGQDKLYGASTSNQALAALNSEKTFVVVVEKPEQYPAEALIGRCAPLTVGSFTWTFKTLTGIDPVGYTSDVVDAIEEKKYFTYIRQGGVDITSNGVTTKGEFIDVIQSQLFMKARMTENVFGLLARMDKVPFDDDGINLVVAEIVNTLELCGKQGIIAKDADTGAYMYTVTAPTRAEVPASTRANRLLPDINWEATIAGAIEGVKPINGVLKV